MLRTPDANVWKLATLRTQIYWLKKEIQNFLPNTSIANGAKVYEKILNAFYYEMASITLSKLCIIGLGNYKANCNNSGYTIDMHHIYYNVFICMPGQTNFTEYRHYFRMLLLESSGLENF